MTTRQLRIAPSILSADFAHLADQCQAVIDAGADWLHVDVMDGHYVPNITIGLPVVEALRQALPDAFLDVHLMIDNPDDFVGPFARAGADLVSFHPETSRHPHRAIHTIKALGKKAGLAINPGTPLNWLDHLAHDLDLALIMSVNPGFGGQAFIPHTVDKIRQLTARLEALGADLDIEVDGGVSPSNAEQLRRAGANVLVAGSAVFGAPNYKQAIDAIRQQASLAG
ncbi:ribulose-phosphate 3-epimerase [Lujinxingia litoralis]|uniref:Ribulose-phosphate 3-epimerase n=1 Tax=Lujinxingia litoralis TaxID=2211119 RepID=A0A328C1L1_9DELT|nr:ribulose-phosphate 3-epimerase [Lujinxingia litoralis]RAL20179.1 ribulose-phosphate 3-epimerase [Lujinxingia litoralis]